MLLPVGVTGEKPSRGCTGRMPEGCLFIIIKDMTQSIPVAPQSLNDVMVQAIDVFHIVKFFWATQDNFSRFETTVIEQIRQTSFTFVRQETANAIPDMLVINGVCIFCGGFYGAIRLWERNLSCSQTQLGTEGIHDDPVEGGMQVT